MANISRKISRSVSRIISRGLGSTIASYFARFFTEASTWVGELLKSSVGDLTLEPTGRWCFKGDGTGYLTFVGLAAYDSITANRAGVGDESTTLTGGDWYPVAGEKYNDLKFFNGATLVNYFPLDNYIAGSTPSVVDFPCVITGIRATLINGAPAVNLSSRSDASRSNNLLGFSLVKEFQGDSSYNLNYIPNDDTVIEFWFKFNEFSGVANVLLGTRTSNTSNDILFQNLSGDIALQIGDDIITTIPTDLKWHHAYLSVESVIIDGVDYGGGTSFGNITTSLRLGTFDVDGVLNDTYAASFMFRNLEIYESDVLNKKITPNELDNTYVNELTGELIESTIPLKQDGTGLDILGLPPTNPAINNGLGYNGCEQTYRCPDIPKEKDQDDIWKSGDGLTVYDVNVGTLNAGDNGNIEIVKDANGNVSDLKIK